jgi:hypothetical protein
MLFLILFSCLRFPERYGCYIFNATRITSFQPLELTLYIKRREGGAASQEEKNAPLL